MAVSRAREIPIDVVGSSTFGIHEKVSPAKTYNMYISDEWLVNYPGYKKIVDLLRESDSNGEGRGLFRSIRGNIAIAVIAQSVWLLDSGTGISFIGTLNTSSGPVFMDENLNGQICIVDGVNAYIYNRFTFALTVQDLQVDIVPSYVCYHNTYFLLGNGLTTGNGAAWFAFSFATDNTITVTYTLALQTKPDFARAVQRLPGKGNNVIVFGTAVAEIQTDVGGLLGYQRVSTINIDYGLLSIATLACSDSFVCWLAINEKNSPCIMVFDGGQATPISSDGIDYVLGNLKHPETSCAFFYKIAGHLFYQITFYDSEDNLSLTYDFNTKKFFHVSDHNLDFHPARQVIYINNRNYFISLNNGSIYEINPDYITYDENIPLPDKPNYNEDHNYIIPRQRICSTVRVPGVDRFIAKKFTVIMEQGQDKNFPELLSLYAGQQAILCEDGTDMLAEDGQLLILENTFGDLEYNPSVDLSFSQDGGYTYSNEVREVVNFEAHRRNVIQWLRLGYGNEMTLKLKFWGKSRFIANNGVLSVTT